MFKRKTTGSVLCTSCGVLVGVNDETCYNCGRRNPSLWGFAPALRALGGDLGFVPFVMGACAIIYGLTLVLLGPSIRMTGVFGFLGPSELSILVFGGSGAYPGVPIGPLVDGAERRVAARRPPAHHPQHAGPAATRTGGGRTVRSGADGDRLCHRRIRSGFLRAR